MTTADNLPDRLDVMFAPGAWSQTIIMSGVSVIAGSTWHAYIVADAGDVQATASLVTPSVSVDTGANSVTFSLTATQVATLIGAGSPKFAGYWSVYSDTLSRPLAAGRFIVDRTATNSGTTSVPLTLTVTSTTTTLSVVAASISAAVVAADTPPSTPSPGMLWENTATGGTLYEYIGGAWAQVYGSRGTTGPTGNTGATGPAGTSMLYGSGAPSSGTGSNGDFYIDTSGLYLYGPKASGSWPSGTSIVGATGPAGSSSTATSLTYTATTTPSSPSAGYGAQYAKVVANRELPYWLSSTGAEHRLARHPGGAHWVQFTPQATTSIRQTGTGTTGSTQGSVTTVAATASVPIYTNQVTSGSAGGATAYGGDLKLYRGASSDLYAGFYFDATLYFPDASYDNTGASTGARVGVGLSDTAFATLNNNDHFRANSNTAAFNRSHVNGGSTDTTWQFITVDGTTRNVVNTTMTFTARHVYRFRIWCPAGSTSVYYQVDDLTAGTVKTGSSSSNLPTTTTAMNPSWGVYSIDAVARNIGMCSMYAETDKG